jgi:hypothetical protein
VIHNPFTTTYFDSCSLRQYLAQSGFIRRSTHQKIEGLEVKIGIVILCCVLLACTLPLVLTDLYFTGLLGYDAMSWLAAIAVLSLWILPLTLQKEPDI